MSKQSLEKSSNKKSGAYQGKVFKTDIGYCGISWNSQEEITAFHFPENSRELLEKNMKKNGALLVRVEVTSIEIQRLIEKIKKHLSGNSQDFSRVKLCLDHSTEFQKMIYAVVKNIPSGKVLTYKDLGEHLGGMKAYRAIGSAMGKNPIPLIIPCHRVVGSNGQLGGFTAPGGLNTKLKLLKIEKFL